MWSTVRLQGRFGFWQLAVIEAWELFPASLNLHGAALNFHGELHDVRFELEMGRRQPSRDLRCGIAATNVMRGP